MISFDERQDRNISNDNIDVVDYMIKHKRNKDKVIKELFSKNNGIRMLTDYLFNRLDICKSMDELTSFLNILINVVNKDMLKTNNSVEAIELLDNITFFPNYKITQISNTIEENNRHIERKSNAIEKSLSELQLKIKEVGSENNLTKKDIASYDNKVYCLANQIFDSQTQISNLEKELENFTETDFYQKYSSLYMYTIEGIYENIFACLCESIELCDDEKFKNDNDFQQELKTNFEVCNRVLQDYCQCLSVNKNEIGESCLDDLGGMYLDCLFEYYTKTQGQENVQKVDIKTLFTLNNIFYDNGEYEYCKRISNFIVDNSDIISDNLSDDDKLALLTSHYGNKNGVYCDNYYGLLCKYVLIEPKLVADVLEHGVADNEFDIYFVIDTLVALKGVPDYDKDFVDVKYWGMDRSFIESLSANDPSRKANKIKRDYESYLWTKVVEHNITKSITSGIEHVLETTSKDIQRRAIDIVLESNKPRACVKILKHLNTDYYREFMRQYNDGKIDMTLEENQQILKDAQYQEDILNKVFDKVVESNNIGAICKLDEFRYLDNYKMEASAIRDICNQARRARRSLGKITEDNFDQFMTATSVIESSFYVRESVRLDKNNQRFSDEQCARLDEILNQELPTFLNTPENDEVKVC